MSEHVPVRGHPSTEGLSDEAICLLAFQKNRRFGVREHFGVAGLPGKCKQKSFGLVS